MTTSPTWSRRPRPNRRGAPGGRRREIAPPHRYGFTLLEVLLALILVAFLAGLVVVNLADPQGLRKLEEGSERFASVLRMARAEAANRGRQVQLTFDEETGDCRVLWEPDPLGEPRKFTDFTACTWLSYLPNGLVRTVRSQLVGSSAYRTLSGEQMREDSQAEDELAGITFYPDGSSDSAVVEMIVADEDVSWDSGEYAGPRAILELDGLNGTITRSVLTAAELEELQNAPPAEPTTRASS